MSDIFSLLISLFSDFITFLDSFKIIGNLSMLKLIFILILFNIAFKFLFNHKGSDE